MESTVSIAAVAFAAVLCCTSANAGHRVASNEAAEILAGFEPTGETTDCLSVRAIRHIKPLDERHLLVEAGGAYYLSETSTQCRGATRSYHRLQYDIPSTRLCKSEIITVVDNQSGFTVGSCSLGEFQKLEKVEDSSAD